MKRILSLVLCCCIILSAFGVDATAEKAAQPSADLPTVLVTGFLCSKLYIDYATADETDIWKDIFSRIPSNVFGDFSCTASSLYKLIKGDAEAAGETFAQAALNLLERIKCNPDGTSAERIEHYPNDPAISNLAYMFEYSEEYIYEKNFCEYLATVTDPSKVFPFNYDSRADAVTLAQELDEYIEAVLDYTGAEKVNVFALSYGGLISATYLSKYADKNRIDRLVMAVPALGGTDIPEKILRGNIDIADEDLVSFIETVLGSENGFSRFFMFDRAEWLDGFAKGLCNGLSGFVANWGSVWSLCSPDLYDGLKADFLDPDVNSEIIRNSDYVQHCVRPNLGKIFSECRSRGTKISLICGMGSEIITGGTLNGDFILPASGVSGALCAPLGQRFSSAYKGAFTVCRNRTHSHISPSKEIDATTAYLPENTWFVQHLYHGQYNYENYTRSLITKLLYTDEINDIYSNSDYPQFEYSSHVYQGVHAAFDGSPSGFYSGSDSLIIKSLSEDCYIKILSVLSDGVEFKFDLSDVNVLKPGESVKIPVTLQDELNTSKAVITVSYLKIGSLTPMCVSEFGFTVEGDGEVNEPDAFMPSGFETRLSRRVSKKTYDFLLKISLAQAAECVYNTYVTIKENK